MTGNRLYKRKAAKKMGVSYWTLIEWRRPRAALRPMKGGIPSIRVSKSNGTPTN